MTTRIKGTQKRAAETRSAILEAVARLWKNRAFDTIAIAEIAAAAGVAKGTVLAHFAEKGAILAGFLAEAIERQCDDLESTQGFARDPETLASSVEPLLSYMLTDRALLRLLIDDGDNAACAAMLDPALARLGAVLTAGFRSKGLRDADLGAEVFIALATHVVSSGHVPDAAAARMALARLAAILYR